MCMEVDVALKAKFLERNKITLQPQRNSYPEITIGSVTYRHQRSVNQESQNMQLNL